VDCAFCAIVAGRAESVIVWDDDRVVAFMDHIGQTRRRRRRATSTMTEAVPVKETSTTEMPSRANRRLNAVVTRTDGPSFGRRENRQT